MKRNLKDTYQNNLRQYGLFFAFFGDRCHFSVLDKRDPSQTPKRDQPDPTE